MTKKREREKLYYSGYNDTTIVFESGMHILKIMKDVPLILLSVHVLKKKKRLYTLFG
jgi:hypothetical protein